MSSSQRRSLTKSKGGAGACPTCGSTNVVRVQAAVVLRVGRRRIRCPLVKHEVCADWGEKIFGIEASQKLDAVVLGKRKHAAV